MTVYTRCQRILDALKAVCDAVKDAPFSHDQGAIVKDANGWIVADCSGCGNVNQDEIAAARFFVFARTALPLMIENERERLNDTRELFLGESAACGWSDGRASENLDKVLKSDLSRLERIAAACGITVEEETNADKN